MKNMKRNLSKMGLLAASALFITGLMSQTAQANIILGNTYTSILASSSLAGQDITITWDVTLLGPNDYLYEYKVHNTPETITTVDIYNVGFDTTAPGAFIGGTQIGGTAQINGGVNGLTWDLAAVPVGGSSLFLSFESMLPPVLGNADASDHNIPAPWGSVPGGQPVAVPGIPDGGLTVALLGGSLIALRGVYRKKVQN